MALWPDGDNKPKVIYVCPKHGRCGSGNRARGEDGKFNLCGFCLGDEETHRRCVRIPVIPVGAVKDMMAIDTAVAAVEVEESGVGR
jgi:hypothetical protein